MRDVPVHPKTPLVRGPALVPDATGPGLSPTPRSWLTQPAFRLASPARTLVPGAAQLWARPGRGVKPTAGRGNQRHEKRPPSCDQRCLPSCPFLKLALIIHADRCSPGRWSADKACHDARQGRTPVSVRSSSSRRVSADWDHGLFVPKPTPCLVTLRRWAPDLGATVRQRPAAYAHDRWDRYSVGYSACATSWGPLALPSTPWLSTLCAAH